MIAARNVGILVRKDWWLERRAIAAYGAGAVLASVLATLPGTPRSIGATLLLNVIIGMSFHLPMTTVIGERDRRTLPFIMGLPVTPGEHALAKLLANLGLFAVPLLLASAVALGWARDAGGHAPWVVSHAVPGVVLLVLLIQSTVVGVAIASESLGATVGVTVALIFLVGNVGPPAAAAFPYTGDLLHAYLTGRGAFAAVLLALALLLGAVVMATMAAQARKRSFV